MLASLIGKALSIAAKEVVPFILSLLIRDGLRKLRKKKEDSDKEKTENP